MRLFELFDQQYNYTWDEQGDSSWLGHFITKTNKEVKVTFYESNDAWKIDFSTDMEFNVTGGGDAIQIFSTVIAMADDFINVVKPNKMHFIADKSDDNKSKGKLYDRLVKRFAGKNNYTYDIRIRDNYPLVIYTLTRKEDAA